MINVRLGSLTYFGRRLSFLLRSSTVSNGRCDGNRDSSSSSALSNDWQSSKYGFTPKQIGGSQGQSKPAINGLAAGGSGYIVGLLSVTKTANRQVTRQIPPREAAPIGLYLLRRTCWRSSRFALRNAASQNTSGWHAQRLGEGRGR